MDHADHIGLLREGVLAGPRTWADLGAGRGAFTLALADLLSAGGTIYAVDRDPASLRDLTRAYERSRRPRPRLETMVADFADGLALPPLDGVVMANSLHFVEDKRGALARIRALLKPDGRFILVEYDTDRGNEWVPHPLSFTTWEGVAAASGFGAPRMLSSVPSRFLGRIYSALALVGAPTP